MFALRRIAGASSRQRISSALRKTKAPSTNPTSIPPPQSPKAVFLSTRANLRPPRLNNSSIPPYIIALASLPVVGGGYLYYKYLDEVPLTKRKRWIATSAQWENQMGDQEYLKLKQQYMNQVLPKEHRASVTVHRVGSRIAKAAQAFSKEYGEHSTFIQPTFTIVRSDEANAFVLPGNHIFVMTGLFEYVHTEDELAAVLGHEMAHTLARHVGEKISGNVAVQIFARLSLLLDPSGTLLTMIVPTAGLLREMPNSRAQEMEADRIGMHLASLACYDPQAAQHFFQNLQKEDRSTPPEFLSTHPSHESRIEQMQGWLPETNPIYRREEGHACRKIREDMAQARKIATQQHLQREQQRQQRV